MAYYCGSLLLAGWSGLLMHAAPPSLAIATAVPPYPLDQDDVMERVRLLPRRPQNLDRLLPVFTNTGISPLTLRAIEWYTTRTAGQNATASILLPRLDLLENATRQLLDRRAATKGDITSIVVVSTTGIATPTSMRCWSNGWACGAQCRRLADIRARCAGGRHWLARAASQAAVAPGEIVDVPRRRAMRAILPT